MAESLASGKCKPCSGEIPRLSEMAARELAVQVPGWELDSNRKITRRFKFKNFREAQAWVNRVADLAEAEDHHPDLRWSYNRVEVELSTHKIGGLSENDFILAAKIDRIT